MADDLQVGSVVRSTAGRDKGHLFVVVGRQGTKVLVADGRRRTVNRPKRKNLRHVEPVQISTSLEATGSPSGMLTDENVRAMLDGPQSN